MSGRRADRCDFRAALSFTVVPTFAKNDTHAATRFVSTTISEKEPHYFSLLLFPFFGRKESARKELKWDHTGCRESRLVPGSRDDNAN